MKQKIGLFLCLALLLTGCSYQTKTIRFGAADIGGMYYTVANAYAGLASKESSDLKFEVKNTAGSAANLRLLSGNYIDLGIAQADLVRAAHEGTGSFSDNRQQGYRAIAGLYTEACQIIVPADSPIESIEDLAGKTVSLGERESGVLQNALQVLDAYNLQESDFTPEYLSFSESAQAMKEGKIDAAFITAAIPTPAVTNLADSIGVRVLSIDPFAVNVLTKRHSYYTPCTIPANTYAGQSEAAQTVGVRAVVVARNDMPEDQVKSIMQLLFNGQIPFAEKLKNSMQPTLEEATEGIPIAFHPGAAAYYADNDITVDVMNSSDEGKSVSGGQDD